VVVIFVELVILTVVVIFVRVVIFVVG